MRKRSVDFSAEKKLRVRKFFKNKGFTVIEDRREGVIRLYRPKDLQGKRSDRKYMGSSRTYKGLFERFRIVENFRFVTEVTSRNTSRQDLKYEKGESNINFSRAAYPKVRGKKSKQIVMVITGFRKYSDTVGWTVEGYSHNFKSMKYAPEAADEAYVVCMAQLGFTPQRIIIRKIDIREFR